MRTTRMALIMGIIFVMICQCSSGRHVKPEVTIADQRVGLVVLNYWLAADRHLGEAVFELTNLIARAFEDEIGNNTPYQLVHIRYGTVQGVASRHLGKIFATDLMHQADFRSAVLQTAAEDGLDYVLIIYLHNWEFHRIKTTYPNIKMLIHILDAESNEVVFEDHCEVRCDPQLISQVVSKLPGYYDTNTGCDPAERFRWLDPDSMVWPDQSEYPGAAALFLVDEASVNIQIKPGNLLTSFSKYGNIYTTTTRHVAIKIFNERGYRYADVEIPFSDGVCLEDLKARTINRTGQIIALTEDQIHEASLFPGYVFFSDIKAKKFTMPGIEPGCIVEYSYRQTVEYPSLWGEWVFQKPEPMLRSYFALDVPRGLRYLVYFTGPTYLPDDIHGRTENMDQWEIKGGYREGRFSRQPRLTREYILENLPPLKLEQYMPPIEEVVPRLIYCSATFGDSPFLTSWDDISRWYLALIESSLKADGAIKRQLASIIEDYHNQEEKTRAILSYVQKNIRYVAKELGLGKIVPQKAGEVHYQKYADCKGFSALLVSMLREAGIEAYPVILKTKNEGLLDKRYVSLDQFNHMIVLAEVDGRDVWLDPTASRCPYGHIPWYLQGSEAFVMRERADFMTIPVSEVGDNLLARTIRIQVGQEGMATSSGQIHIEGQGRMEMAERLRELNPDERESLIQEYVSKSIPEFEKTVCSHSSPDSLEIPLTIELQGNIYHVATVAGDAIIIKPGKLIALNMYEFSDDRIHDLVFSYPQSTHDEITIEIPSGYRIEQPFSPIESSCPAGDYVASCRSDDDEIVYVKAFSLKQDRIPTDQISRLKRFYERVRDANQQEVILTRLPAKAAGG